MLLRQPDIPFNTDDAHRFMPWLVAIMVGLAALLLSLGLSVNTWVIGRHGDYNGTFTVNIPADDNQAERVSKVRAALDKTPGVASVNEIDADKLKAMLAPWLGNSPMDDLPLPTMLEITLEKSSTRMNYAGLQKGLSTLAPGIEVDAHERWASAFSQFSAAIRLVTAVLALLIIGGMGATVAFASRAALKLHSKTVHLLHTIGAEDDYIMRQFQQEAVRVAFPGAAAGCAAAAVFYYAMSRYVASLSLSIVPLFTMTSLHWLLFLLLPIVCAAAAWAVARISISMQLQRSL